MTTVAHAPATLADWAKVEKKAELIAGRIVHYPPTCMLAGRVGGNVVVSLLEYAKRTGIGEAYTDNIGFVLTTPLPNGRETFAPDAAYHTGPFPADEWWFPLGGPTFAVEVRGGDDDYGAEAEAAMAEKRDDYFQAGTKAVWDVDPDAEVVTLYLASDPANGIAFRRGDTAHAGPAVPGWAMSVDDVFE